MRTISIRLDDHTDGVLTAYCERHDLTQTAALKAAIGHLANASRPTPAELAAQLGLIGSFRSSQGDLAENHSQRIKEKLRAKRVVESAPLPRAVSKSSKGPGSRSPSRRNVA